jgi:hypothetical protein
LDVQDVRIVIVQIEQRRHIHHDAGGDFSSRECEVAFRNSGVGLCIFVGSSDQGLAAAIDDECLHEALTRWQYFCVSGGVYA